MNTTGPACGIVYLVGAGPGDPGMITLRAVECLERADLVLYDGLVNPFLLRHTRAAAERTCRGCGGRRMTQEEIVARLIEAARQGKTVVRLKGGDPLIFGRGGEEAIALHAAGVPFEIVPGITAAVAAAACAGIPLTHRGWASSLIFRTGHSAENTPTVESTPPAAEDSGTTVHYMGHQTLDNVVAAMLAAGRDPATPACVVSHAATPRQRTVGERLDRLVDAVRNAGLTAPSVLIVGPVVELRDQMAWFERKPLLGVAVGITRAEEQAESTMLAAYAWGAEPVALPLLQLGDPPDEKTVERSFDALTGFDWVVFTSQNGVRRYLDRLHRTGRDARAFGRAQIAAIGPHTAAALAQYGLRADLVPDEFRAEALARDLTSRLDFSPGRPPRVLWVRASRGRDVLPKELARAGAELSEVVAYTHADCTALPPDVARLLAAGRLPWIGLSSPAIARGLARLLSPEAREQVRGGRTRLAAISPITAETAVEAGLPVAAVAAEASWEGIFRAIADVVAREHAT